MFIPLIIDDFYKYINNAQKIDDMVKFFNNDFGNNLEQYI